MAKTSEKLPDSKSWGRAKKMIESVCCFAFLSLAAAAMLLADFFCSLSLPEKTKKHPTHNVSQQSSKEAYEDDLYDGQEGL